MWYLACCDDEGKCFGFLREDKTVCTDVDNELNSLMKFKRKKDTTEIVLQINMSKMLLPNGYPFRVVAVKG